MRLLAALFRLVLGYGFAVILATIVTISMYILIGPQENGITTSLGTVFFGGLIYTAIFGLPGFLVWLAAYWRFGLNRVLAPVLAGVANGWLAMWLLIRFAGATPLAGDPQNPLLLGMPQFIILSVMVGGAAGGWIWHLAQIWFNRTKAGN